jgi:molybdate/tungstate transport system substrate-binding protein
MVALIHQRHARIGALVVFVAIGLAAAGCGSSSPSTSSSGSSKHTGTVSVAYAASLQFLNEKVVGPAFTKAEGYKYSGTGAASGTLESEIASGEIHPNVF